MNRAKLIAMLLVIGTLIGGGRLVMLRPGFTPADAVDAGILQGSVAGKLRCNVRVERECAADAGLARRFHTVTMRARIIPDAGREIGKVVAFDVPARWEGCIHPMGAAHEACQLIEEGSCTGQGCANLNVEQPACACRRPDAGTCNVRGQPAVVGITLAPGTWTGAGCFRKYCGPELAGENDWPEECPQR